MLLFNLSLAEMKMAFYLGVESGDLEGEQDDTAVVDAEALAINSIQRMTYANFKMEINITNVMALGNRFRIFLYLLNCY